MKNLWRPTSCKRLLFFLLLDSLLSVVTLYLAYSLRFNFYIPKSFLTHFWHVYFVLTLIKLIALYVLKNYFIIWRFFSFVDAKNIIYAHIISYSIFVVIYLSFTDYFAPFARSIIIIDFFLSLTFIGILRASKRLFLERAQSEFKPTLLIGVTSNTGTIIQSALRGDISYYPTAIMSLTKDESSKHAYIHNIKVYEEDALEDVIVKKKITSIIFVEQMAPNILKIMVDKLNNLGIFDIKQVKLLGNNNEKLEDLSIEDLLARHPKDLDLDVIKSFIKGKKIIITGAGGSIGSEIAKQCAEFGAASLTLIDHSEYNLYQIGESLPQAALKLLNITDKQLLEEVFEKVSANIVIHAAAYKHVPICESNQDIAVRNNILGSKIVMDASIKFNVQKVVIISTDKAVRPTSIMGATKRVTELYAQNVVFSENVMSLDKVESSKTEIVAVRFGNVLGSSGSVIPKFKKQIEQGGPVTVTHPDITRYFMLIPEACQLVLQTAAIAKGGELFILDMGEPIKIVDLAKQMIRLYGREDDVIIKYTGLRPGEKLYEELLLDESEQKTKYSSIFIARPTPYDFDQLDDDINKLLISKNKVEMLQKIVPEFSHNL